MKAIRSFTEYLRIEKRYSEHTVRAYTDDMGQFASYLQTYYPGVTPDTAEQYHVRQWILAMLGEKISPRTLRRKVASLSTYYRYCLKKGWISGNPAKGIILPKLEKNLPEFINQTAIDVLFEAPQLKEGFTGIRDKLVLELFYATGMRLSELTQLQDSSYNRVKGEIKVLGKRNKERIIPLTSNIIRILDAYIVQRNELFPAIGHNYLIVTNTGTPVYARMIQLVRKYLMLSTTLEKNNPHLLRHTFATHMLNNGADLNAVKELLGHANLAATEVYTHNTYEKLKSIYKQAHPRA